MRLQLISQGPKGLKGLKELKGFDWICLVCKKREIWGCCLLRGLLTQIKSLN